MAKVINKYAENVMLRSVNRLINKYGHIVTLRQVRSGQPTLDTESKATFGRFKVALGEEWFILNNNYRVRLRADSFPYIIAPDDKVIVNGAELTVITARKISPDGATTIVWELECSGETIPADPNNAAVPTILLPENNTSYYSAVETVDDLSSVLVTASSYVILSGETEYLSTDWQLAEDDLFTILHETETTDTTSWTTPVSLENPKNYYVRARHNGTGGVTTAWSAASLFSLGLIGDTPTEDIQTPTIAFPVTADYVDSSYTRADEYHPYGPWRIYPSLSAFASDTGKEFANTYWQVSTDSGFSTIVLEGSSIGGFDYTVYESFDYNVWVLEESGYFLEDDVQYYLRGKYVATDATESEWADTVAFKIDGNRPPAGGSVSTPTNTTTINSTTKYLALANTYKKVIEGVTKYSIAPQATVFSGVSPADEVDFSYWQVASDSGFTSIIWEGKCSDSFTSDIGSRDYRTLVMLDNTGFSVLYPFDADGTSYYFRVKYLATNRTESAYSPTYEFKINPAK